MIMFATSSAIPSHYHICPSHTSPGIRVLLEESGNHYGAERIDLASQQQFSEPVSGDQPESMVPAFSGRMARF
jgi:glutathione S-transferase